MSAGFAFQRVRVVDVAPVGWMALGELVGEYRRTMEFSMDGALISVSKDSLVQVESGGYFGRRSAVTSRWRVTPLIEDPAENRTPRDALDSRRRQRETLARWRAASGRRETVEEFLARGGAITRCPSVYVAPVQR